LKLTREPSCANAAGVIAPYRDIVAAIKAAAVFVVVIIVVLVVLGFSLFEVLNNVIDV